jgi:pimeloyl-ACP methyl ester carboxylesterase
MNRPKLQTILTDTLEIAYEESGEANGQPVILLHGFPDDARSWDGVVGPLAADGFRTIVPYLRGYGPTRFRQVDTLRSGQQAALGHDLLGLIDGLKLQQSTLVGFDWGARAACIVAALWPAKVAGLVPICGYNIESYTQDREPAPARQEYRGWYQWYFQTERGKAGLEQRRHEICRLLWELWSPNWRFTDADFAESGASFDNPDFVAVVLHSYRHRYRAAAGDPRFDAVERQLAARPTLSVPTIALHGECDGVYPPQLSEGQEKHFTGHYERRVIPVAGHFFPREAPDAVVEAVRELAGRRASRGIANRK